eukprot:SM000049S16695  [mRNA]  locus=s49:93424:102369:+ [translate_table: standard]
MIELKVAAAAALLLAQRWYLVHAIVIAKSDITECLVQGPHGDGNSRQGVSPAPAPAPSHRPTGRSSPASSMATMDCQNKVVVSITVSNGQTEAAQALETVVSSVQDGNGTSHKLTEPLMITITKSPVYAVYPLTYIQSFNGKPYEEVVLTKHCDDGNSASKPTCGWFLNPDGSHIYASQGFCCKCRADSAFDQSILGTSGGSYRAHLDCSLWSQGLFLGGIPASAHCLRFSDTWYPTYEIGPATLEFQLQITTAKEVLTLSASSPVALNKDRTVSATLIGDFITYTQLPVLASYYLSVPQMVAGSLGNLTTSVTGWLILDKSVYTLDGSECNKVGSSFAAFRYEASRCQKQVGSCLANQLADYAKASITTCNGKPWRVSRGDTPLYALTAMGAVSPHIAGDGNLSIAIVVDQILNSLVTLELNADNITYLVNKSPGQIINATLPDFEAISSSGKMVVLVRNTGGIVADYIVSKVRLMKILFTATSVSPARHSTPIFLTSSSVVVLLINKAQEVSILPQTTKTLLFDIKTQDGQEDVRECLVKLYDSTNLLIDTHNVTFHTNATVDMRGSQGGQSDGTRLHNTTSFSSHKSSCHNCPLIFNMACLVANHCWVSVGKLVGSLLGVLAVGALVILALRLLHNARLLGPLVVSAATGCGLFSRALAARKSKAVDKLSSQVTAADQSANLAGKTTSAQLFVVFKRNLLWGQETGLRGCSLRWSPYKIDSGTANGLNLRAAAPNFLLAHRQPLTTDTSEPEPQISKVVSSCPNVERQTSVNDCLGPVKREDKPGFPQARRVRELASHLSLHAIRPDDAVLAALLHHRFRPHDGGPAARAGRGRSSASSAAAEGGATEEHVATVEHNPDRSPPPSPDGMPLRQRAWRPPRRSSSAV